MSKEVPVDLIHALAASTASNAAESITLAVRELGEKHGLSIQAQMEIGALVITQRQQAVESAMEAARLAMAEVLGVRA